MSVRRLAEEAVQPKKFAFSRANASEANKWIGKYPKGRQASAVIPLLMLAQEQDGWVTRVAIENVAEMLDMPVIRVLEVATFYTQFQLAPVGSRAHVQVCGTTPCMLRGAGDLIALCRRRIHAEPFHVNEAGTLSWEEVECQGACVNAPMVMIHKDTYEDLTTERLEEIVDAFEAGKGNTIQPGPQIDRIYSAPEGGLTSLTDEKAIFVKRAGKPQKAGASGPAVPPSKAAKPKTDTVETSDAIKSPAKGKSGKAQDRTGRSMNQPASIERPPQPDNLRLISGVGPKIEGILHELGIYTFDQIAAWKAAERDWVDNYLKFKGRVERDDWVKQASVLASGGAAEYEKVFGKKPK
jgi:NADH-quinone oxidoreductase subunit E